MIKKLKNYLKSITTTEQRQAIRALLTTPILFMLRQRYLVAEKASAKSDDYLDWLIENIYQGYFLKQLEHTTHDPALFNIADLNEYKKLWYELLTINTKELLNYDMNVSNLILPNHQSEQQLARYYELNQNLFVARYLQYPLLDPGYLKMIVEPYQYALDELDTIKYCELGPGLPHGLFHLAYVAPEAIRAKLNTVELIDFPLIYREMTEHLVRHLFPETKLYITDSHVSEPPELKSNPNFIIGKDVFEHVFNPDKFVIRLLDAAGEEECIFAADLRDREPEKYQHVSLSLSHLEQLATERGFKFIGDTSRLNIYRRYV